MVGARLRTPAHITINRYSTEKRPLCWRDLYLRCARVCVCGFALDFHACKEKPHIQLYIGVLQIDDALNERTFTRTFPVLIGISWWRTVRRHHAS